MAITLTYNGYTHPIGEATVAVQRQTLLTAAQTPYAETVQIALNGTIVGDSPGDLNTKLLLMTAAYAVDGRDFLMQTDDVPVVVLGASIISANTLGGIRVVKRPGLPEMKNAAYVTFLNYQIVLEATIAKASAWTLLRSFSEQISFSGGGPVYGLLQTRVGLPQRQLLTRNAIYKAVQAGQAVGLYRTPPIPAPIWPAWRTGFVDRQITGGRLVGEGAGSTYMDYAVRWRYTFESPVPLVGTPTSWGVA